jgi:predicted O-methyltransferase YrrM
MNIIGEYIKYLLNSKGKHKIHSPFVYDLLTKCLELTIDEDAKTKIKKIRKGYQKNQSILSINDAGQGSKTLHTNRKISKIYQTAASKGVYADMLYQIVKFYKLKKSLELGTSLGIGTFYLASGNPTGYVTTIDASKETQNIAKEQLSSVGLSNINFINRTFIEYFEQKPTEIFDLIFIDGHHNGQALLNYLQLLANNMHDETIIIVDDIRWSDDMFEAWNKLILDENYHLTLDLFRMGIIMKRHHQAKEHFILKLKGILKGML